MSSVGRLTRRSALIGASLMLMAPPAFAHRSQSVLTTVNWNPATSTLEVMHRIHAHDAEVGLAASEGSASVVDLTVVQNQARLMLYVENHFSLKAAGRAISLSALGAEFESEAILLYQEAKLSTPPAELAIDNQILRDIFDQQTNLVNVKVARKTRTLIFAGSDGVKQAKDLL